MKKSVIGILTTYILLTVTVYIVNAQKKNSSYFLRQEGYRISRLPAPLGRQTDVQMNRQFRTPSTCAVVAAGRHSALRIPVYPTIKVSGYIQARYTMDKDGANNFQTKRARGKFSGNASEKIKYSLLFDFIDDKKGSNLADAYIDIGYLPQATVRMGQFKTPFSMEYLTSSTKWDTIQLAQVVSKLASKRDIGIQISGDVSPLEYAVGVFNGTGSNAAEENKRKDIIAHMVIKPVTGLLLSVSHYEGWSGKEDENKTKRRTGAQLRFINKPLSVKGEFIFGKNGETSAYGWYAQIGYTLPIPLGKSNQKPQAIVKYDSYDPNGDEEKDKMDIATVGLNWFITKSAKLQVNNQLILNEDFEVDNDVVLAQFQAIW